MTSDNKFHLSLPWATTPGLRREEITEPPSEIFCQTLGCADPAEARLLWQYYLDWRQDREADVIREFAKKIAAERENADREITDLLGQLPNGKKGEPYSFRFTLPPSIRILKMQVPQIKGIAAYTPDGRQWLISGVPDEAGEFKITFGYILNGHPKPGKFIMRQASLIINPDPRDLWRDLPVDPGLEYYKDNEESQLLKTPNGIMLAASGRGRSHAHKGLPRDDDFSLFYDDFSGWHIMAVADGAGSATFSRKGSEIACAAALHSCRTNLRGESSLDNFLASYNQLDRAQQAEAKKLAYRILPQAALEAFKSIREEAKLYEREPRDYATTLLLCAFKRYPAGWAVLSFQIGDGAIGLLRLNDQGLSAELLAEPDEGEFGGQTRFITMQEMFESHNLMRRLRVDFVPNLAALMLMTDGVSDAKFSSTANMRDQEHWSALWGEIAPLAKGADPENNLLKWLEFWSPGNHDDRTLALFM